MGELIRGLLKIVGVILLIVCIVLIKTDPFAGVACGVFGLLGLIC